MFFWPIFRPLPDPTDGVPNVQSNFVVMLCSGWEKALF